MSEQKAVDEKDEEKDNRPPPPKPPKGSIGIKLGLKNTTVPTDLMPDEIAVFKEIAGEFLEKTSLDLSSEYILYLLGIATGNFKDFRKSEDVSEKHESSFEDKVKAGFEQYNWVAYSDSPLSESLRKLLENLENEKVISQIEGKDCFTIN